MEFTQYAETKRLVVCEISMPRYDGLLLDKLVLLNTSMPTSYKKCALAEELGHYHLTVGNILDQSVIGNQKQEHKARAWAYEKAIPVENIYFAIHDGYTEAWEIAEYLDVSEPFLLEAIEYYKTQGCLFGEAESR